MRHRRALDIGILIITAVITLGSLSLIGTLHIDSSTEAFMPEDAQVVQLNKTIEAEFGTLDAIIVGVMVKYGTILEPMALQTISVLTERLADVEGVQRVTSLAQVDHITSGFDGLEVVPLLQGTDAQDIAALTARLNAWSEVYEGTLISADKRLAAVVVQPHVGLSPEATVRVLADIRAIAATVRQDNLTIALVGLPVVKSEINRSLAADMVVLIPIVAFIILLVLLLAFRNIAGVLIPLVSLIVSASVVIGIMAVFQITFTMATMLVPVLLLIVGSAYGIHVMSHFTEEVSRHKEILSPEEIVRIIRTVLTRNTMPVIMAGATTAAGFIAQFASPLGPFRTFGLLSAIGVVLSQISSLLLIPLLLRLTYRKGLDPAKYRHQPDTRFASGRHRTFDLLETIATKGFIPLAIGSVALLVVTLALLPSIQVGTNMLDFFKPKSQLVQDTNLYANQMNGSGVLTVMVEGDGASSILEPRFLQVLAGFSTYMESLPEVGKAQTVVPYIQRINRMMNHDSIPYASKASGELDFDFFGSGSFGAESFPLDSAEEQMVAQNWETIGESNSETYLQAIAKAFAQSGPSSDLKTFVETLLANQNYDGASFDEIPLDPAKYGLETQEDLQNLISQYLVMYSGNLTFFINDALEPDKTLITLQLRQVETDALRRVVAEAKGYWDHYLPEGWSYDIGGGDAVSLTLTDLVTRSQILSLIGALLIVWLLVSIMFRSALAGLYSLIPVVFALMGIFTSMALLGIHLDIITSLLAALAIGIGVDYAIHFMSACRRLSYGEHLHGLRDIYLTTGRAIIINASSVALGFSGLIFSRFIPIQQMGILFTVSMVFSALASLTILPMVIYRYKPKFIGFDTTKLPQAIGLDITTRRASK
jgi:hypothetical protein